MDATALFAEHKDAVCAEWVTKVYATYPLDTKGFLRTQSDPFLNPVGDMTHECAQFLYAALSGADMDGNELESGLERFVRLRAVQDFSPSKSLAVLFVMKDIARELLLPQFEKTGLTAEYLEAESRLDTVALMAFDMYAKNREVLLEQRILEIKNQHAQLVRWAQTVDGGPAGGSGEHKL